MVYYQYITAADLPRSIPFFVTSEGVVFNQWGLNPAPPSKSNTGFHDDAWTDESEAISRQTRKQI